MPKGEASAARDRWKPQSMKPHYRGMARALVAGVKPQELPSLYGMTKEAIGHILASPLFMAEVMRLEDMAEEVMVDVRGELEMLSGRAVEVISQDLYRDDPSAGRTKTAFDVLDRTGFHARQAGDGKKGTTINILNLAPEPGTNPEEAKETINEIKRRIQVVEDSEALLPEDPDEVSGKRTTIGEEILEDLNDDTSDS